MTFRDLWDILRDFEGLLGHKVTFRDLWEMLETLWDLWGHFRDFEGPFGNVFGTLGNL